MSRRHGDKAVLRNSLEFFENTSFEDTSRTVAHTEEATHAARMKSIVHTRGVHQRRAASLAHDFVELYLKVDVNDLDEIHAKATSFVRMLIDEYGEKNKRNSAKNLHRGNCSASAMSKGCDVETLTEPDARNIKKNDDSGGLGEMNAEIDDRHHQFERESYATSFCHGSMLEYMATCPNGCNTRRGTRAAELHLPNTAAANKSALWNATLNQALLDIVSRLAQSVFYDVQEDEKRIECQKYWDP
ncbi:hypothetical protein KIN20_005423 [Parelaphostrongylus tenuis]|uniref:Uncharacterized protein n=1 Tax=Parelaphostrongylus tenuis TaxID=148309 RepID=A0AAD5M4H2_PARTN|nr:hypothetical protein KIN20_005423 [Parelaphostrongylus tenuis]